MAMEAGSLAARCNILFPVVQATKGMLRYYEGRLDEAIEHLEDARTLAKAQGDRMNEYMANEYLAMLEVDRGDFTAALARCEPLVEIGSRLREGSEYPFALGLRALCEYSLNGSDESLAEHLQVVREVDAKARLTYLLNRVAALDIRYGRLDLALARGAEALQLAELMERPTETLLAHLNLVAVKGQLKLPGEGEHLATIKALMTGVVARWARERAVEQLTQSR
jgi:tetratricopeptide (TPR) repeat protein